jgi:hypothetical protein
MIVRNSISNIQSSAHPSRQWAQSQNLPEPLRFVEKLSNSPLEVSNFCWREASIARLDSFAGTLVISLPNVEANVVNILHGLMDEFNPSKSTLDSKDQIDWDVTAPQDCPSPVLLIRFPASLPSSAQRSSLLPLEKEIATVRMKRWVKRVIIGCDRRANHCSHLLAKKLSLSWSIADE